MQKYRLIFLTNIKMSNKQTLIYTKKPKKKSIINFKILWYHILILLIIIFFIVLIPFYTNILKKQVLTNANYHVLDLTRFSNGVFTVNYLIFMYSICMYFYRKEKTGPKGPPGDLGEIGEQGENMECDICTPQIRSISKVPKNTKLPSLDDSIFKKNMVSRFDANDWVSVKKKINNTLGLNKSNCYGKIVTYPSGRKVKDKCKNTGVSKVPTFVNGSIINYDKMSGDIYSMQYLYNDSQNPNIENPKLLDKIIGGTYQGDKKMGHGDFKCPKGAGIFRIDAVYTSDKNSKESSGIKGLKFFCRNVKTGEDVLIRDKNENLQDSITYGIEPSKTSTGNNKFASVECKIETGMDGNKRQSFISDVSAIAGNRINALKVHTCKYYTK